MERVLKLCKIPSNYAKDCSKNCAVGNDSSIFLNSQNVIELKSSAHSSKIKVLSVLAKNK